MNTEITSGQKCHRCRRVYGTNKELQYMQKMAGIPNLCGECVQVLQATLQADKATLRAGAVAAESSHDPKCDFLYLKGPLSERGTGAKPCNCGAVNGGENELAPRWGKDVLAGA